MNYRQKLYSEYASGHTSHLYREASLNRIQKQFVAWNSYYGRYLPKDKNTKILEIGCGNGGFLHYLKILGYKNCFGIDISEEQIELARKLGIENVEVSDLKTFLKDKERNWNVILARDILEHFRKEEILEVLRLAYNALLENGILIVQSPNAEGPFGGRYRYGDFTHEIAFTRSSLSQILRIIGFKKLKFHSTGPVIHGIKSVVRYFLWKGIEVLLRFYMLVETGSNKGIFTQNLICIAEK